VARARSDDPVRVYAYEDERYPSVEVEIKPEGPNSLPWRLVKNLRKAHQILEEAEEDIREYLRSTGQKMA
jgi:hypothetical protein